jgi:hypothetical protein
VANTSREASVRLSLDNGQFLVSMRQVGDTVDKETKRATKSSQMWGAGISKVGDTLKGLGGHVKNLASMAGTLGGAFTLGSAAHGAIKLESSYRNLAFSIKAGKGEAVSFKSLMADGNAIALRWGRSNDEVAGTVRALYDDIGDIDFARKGANEIAKAATATGASVGSLTTIAGQLNEKFGITAEQLPDAMAAVVAAASKGGIGIEDMGEKMGLVGATAKLAGMEGKEGFQRMMGMLNLADGATGNLGKTVKSVTGLFDKMVDPATIEKAKKELKLNLVDKSGTLKKDALQQLLQKTGGKREELAKVFTGDQLKLLVDFGKTYAGAFDASKGDIKTKTAAGLAAFDAAIAQAGQQTLTAADLQAEAMKRTEDPQVKFQQALNTLQNAMGRPEIVKAINQLAAALPRFAEVVSKVIGWVADNPMTAAGGVAGAVVGKSFLEGALAKAGTTFAEQAFGGAGRAGSSFAAAAFGPVVLAAAAFAIGQAIGTAIQDSIEAKHADKRKQEATKLQAEIDEAQGMSESAAVAKFGERGKRYKQGNLTNAERLQLAVQDAKTDSDAMEVQRGMSRKFEGEAQVKAMGFDPTQGANKPMSALELVKLNKAGILGDDAVKGIKQIVPTGFGGLNAPAGGGAAPGPSPEVEIKNTQSFAQTLANALKGSTLKVEISNPPGGVGTRGAPLLPPPRPGGG